MGRDNRASSLPSRPTYGSLPLSEPAPRGAPASAMPPPGRSSLLVAGAGGTLGAAVLAEALAGGRHARVLALVAAPLATALRGFEPLPLAALGSSAVPPVDTAIVVYERARRSHGRDDAFVRPDPAALLPLAHGLHAWGVRRLLVLVPHAPALLPQALKFGLASTDEAAVAALGFEQLVFVRAALPAGDGGDGGAMQRFAGWWLSQLRWMVPQREQPLRTAALARCVALLAALLPEAAPGTRVLTPEVLWQAAQSGADPETALHRWLQAPRRP